MRLVPRLLLPLLALVLLAVPAGADAFRLGEVLRPVAGNPADAVGGPVDPVEYDAARRCTPKPRPGVVRFERWMQRHAKGASWGIYRCERWGRRSASLHAEGRALDWHLDVRRPADKAEARRIIRLLLAPDRHGEPHALARRMGVIEIIWDCSYWGAGMEEFSRYRPCFGRSGKPRRRVNPTIAHRDHLHIGLSRAGAAGRTSFWER